MNENLKGLISLFSSNHVTNEGTVYNRNRSNIYVAIPPYTCRLHGACTLYLDHDVTGIWTRKRGEGEEEHDTVEGDAHTIISCIIFSMSCVLFLIVIVFVYDVVKYTKFGRNYLTVSFNAMFVTMLVTCEDKGFWWQPFLSSTFKMCHHQRLPQPSLNVSGMLKMSPFSALESQDCKTKSQNTVEHFQSLPYHSQQVNSGQTCLKETPWSLYKTKKCVKQRSQK